MLTQWFACASKSDACGREQTYIPGFYRLTVRNEFSAFVLTLGSNDIGILRNEHDIRGWLGVLKGAALLILINHDLAVNGIYCPLLDFMSQESGDIVYGETSVSVEFKAAVLPLFEDCCPSCVVSMRFWHCCSSSAFALLKFYLMSQSSNASLRTFLVF